MRRWLLALAALPLVLAALGAGFVLWNVPGRTGGAIAGLAGPVTVTLDDRGVPHVVAATIGDALRAQGWLTARDRAFQLELLRRAAGGELAEVFGKAALESDRRHRRYGFARVAAAAVPLLPKEEREDLESLAAGINAYVESHRGRLGVELPVFGIRMRPWTPADSLLVLLLMNEDLSSRWESELDNERIAKLPPSLRDFLTPHGTTDDVTLIPDAAPFTPAALPDLGGASLPAAAELRLDEPAVAASNGWAVSGALTASGKPMLVNDPHLGLTLPGIWLPMRFEIGGRPVEGVTLPGLPGVILGRNARLAWGFTNLMTDVQDLYTEPPSKPRRTRVETIAVKGAPAERLEVSETDHGPLVDEVHALRWLVLDPANVRLPSRAVMFAATPEELDAALDGFTAPGQNVVFATADGHIGWRAAGLVPLRRSGTDGSVPYDGADPENDWRGVVPVSSMPRVLDPPHGYVVTANQRVVGTSSPVFLTNDWPSPVRARRIRQLVALTAEHGGKLDRDGAEAFQRDIGSASLREFAESVSARFPETWRARFRGWDGGARADDALTLVARSVRTAFREKALGTWGVARYRRFVNDDLWNALAASEDAAYRRAGLGAKDAFLDACVAKTFADLRKRFGADESRWTWGAANRLGVKHPLGYVPGLAWLFDPPHPPQAGHGGTVTASSPTYGQSMRHVVDWGAPEATTLVIPFGVSGHLGSGQRVDQLRFWLGGDPDGVATRLARRAEGKPIELVPGYH